MDCSLPGSSVRGILQARILEWVAIPFSRASSQPRDGTQVSCTAAGFFNVWAAREEHIVAIVNNAAMNMGWRYLSISCFHFLQIYIQKWDWWIVWQSYFYFRNFCTIFHSGCSNSHSHQQCTRVSFSPHPKQLLLIYCLFDISHILTGVRCYLTVVLICIFLMTGDIDRQCDSFDVPFGHLYVF